MALDVKEAEIDRSALIIVDMQNDFLHPDGGFAHLAREHPEANIDMPFLRGTIPHVSRLAEAFRSAVQCRICSSPCPFGLFAAEGLD